MRIMNLKWLCLGLLGWSLLAHAYDEGVCYPTSGSPGVTRYVLSGAIPAAHDTLGYPAATMQITNATPVTYQCVCSDPNAVTGNYYSAALTVPAASGNSQRFLLSPSVSADISLTINFGTYKSGRAIPFTGQGNSATTCGVSGSATQGGNGTATIHIIQKIISGITFHQLVAKVWHYHKANYLNQADPPERLIYVDADLSVPDNCTLMPGSTLTVDLGRLTAHQFKDKAYTEIPANYTPKDFQLKFSCNFANAALDVDLIGNKDNLSQGFATTKSDISVIILDKNGNIVPPDGRAGSVTVGADNNSSTLAMKAYPTTSGNIPSTGEFSTTATILLSYE